MLAKPLFDLFKKGLSLNGNMNSKKNWKAKSLQGAYVEIF